MELGQKIIQVVQLISTRVASAGKLHLAQRKKAFFSIFCHVKKDLSAIEIQKEWEQEWKTLEEGRHLCRIDQT